MMNWPTSIFATLATSSAVIYWGVPALVRNTVGAAREGFIGVSQEQLGESVRDFLQDTTQKVIHTAGEALKGEGQNIFAGGGGAVESIVQTIFTQLGQTVKNLQFQEGLKDLGKSFADGLRDMAKDSKSSLSEGIREFFSGGEGTAKELIKNIFEGLGNLVKSDELREGIRNLTHGSGENLTEFVKSIRDFLRTDGFRRSINEMGADLRRTANDFSFPAIDGVTDVFHRVMGNISFSALTTIIPTVAIAGIAVVGTPLLATYLYRRAVFMLGRPKLMIDRRTISFLTPLKNLSARIFELMFRTLPKATPIFNKTISRRIKEISDSVKNAYAHGGDLQNTLLYGPGGTGKTMIARKIAEDAGFNYVMMSGADLSQYIKRGEHVTELNRLLATVKNSSHPTVLFIDEVDSFGNKRDNSDQDRVDLLTAFLKETGTASKKLMLIMATNRLHTLDSALLSRTSHKIYIGPPDYYSRIAILKQDIAIKFGKSSETKTVLDDSSIAIIASKTYGLSGRALNQLVTTLMAKKHATKNDQLTSEIVDQTVSDLVTQERQMPDAERSWFFIEIPCDFWYFTLARIRRAFLQAFAFFGDFSLSPSEMLEVPDEEIV